MIKKIFALLLLLGNAFFTQAQQSAQTAGSSVTPVTGAYQLQTDKAVYSPGAIVRFEVAQALPAGSYVEYWYLGKVVARQQVSGSGWEWKTPMQDFKGYLAAVFTPGASKPVLAGTIGIDVSSSWAKFPRYGFLSKYPKLTNSGTEQVIATLNRYHINGLQFYDWLSRHHQPLAGSAQQPDSVWKDIANRPIYFQTVKQYIQAAHGHNMKAMFYNLVYGALKDAAQHGVNDRWYLYDDSQHQTKEKFALPSNFCSDIWFTNPANTQWQAYLNKENQKVYQALPFDGYHMDQVGNRDKTLFDYDGKVVALDETFGKFVSGIKALDAQRPVVINAVNQYGQQGIGRSPVAFMYSEVWPPNDDFGALAQVITDNDRWSGYSKPSVLAAYMNYDMAEHEGNFNTPAILMADAVIFAFGGSHLELGEHMLCKEYFPNSNLAMKEDLRAGLYHYYDFEVAYENLLRDGGKFDTLSVRSANAQLKLGSWPARQGQVAVVAKRMKSRDVIHFLNFTNAATMSWRDNKGIQTEPKNISGAQVVIPVVRPVKKVWLASPDFNQALPQTLSFKQGQGKIQVTLTDLKYWDMLVLEY